MNTSIDSIFANIEKNHPKSIDLSLKRLWPLLSAIGDPHLKLPPTIHIAGTNGKGSTAAFLHSILTKIGLRAAMYTSPHLVHVNERIIFASGKPVDDETLTQALIETQKAASKHHVTLFEFITSAAFLIFSQQKHDFLILETGLGGRLDATNVIPNPALTILTRIGKDHTEFLGNTIEDIIKEKIGIAKPNTPMLIAPQHERTKNLIKQYLKEKNITCHSVDDDVSISSSSEHWAYKDERALYSLTLPSLRGNHQIENASTAIRALHLLFPQKKNISASLIKKAISSTHWPARLQKLPPNPPLHTLGEKWYLLLDGGHNRDAGFAIARFIREYQANTPSPLSCHLIIGMLRQKDVLAFLKPLNPLVASIHTISIPNTTNSHTATSLSEIAFSVGINARPAPSLAHAVNTISQLKPGILVIAGSLYLAGHIFKEINLNPYEHTQ
jgi:dihydrofolate synthase/folylpolyglutamate synthase